MKYCCNNLKCHCDSDISRKKQSLIFFSFISVMMMFQLQVFAQSTRGLVNDGVDLYKEKKFADAEVNFKKGIEKSPESFEAKFNLGDAYYKQEKYPDAIIAFQQSLSNTTEVNQRAKAYFNIGNSFLKLKKMNESIKAYKEALKQNPNDIDAKYNLSYALKLSKQGSSTSSSDPNTPSEYAKQLKAKADELIIKYRYKEAYDLMIEGLKIDPTVGHYKDFIERTKNVVDIEEWI